MREEQTISNSTRGLFNRRLKQLVHTVGMKVAIHLERMPVLGMTLARSMAIVIYIVVDLLKLDAIFAS